MQRVATLINILQQKLQQNAAIAELIITCKMLEAELMHLNSITPPATLQVPNLATIKIINTPAIVATTPVIINTEEQPLKLVEVLQINEAEVLAELDSIKQKAIDNSNLSYQNRPAIQYDNMDDIPTMVDRHTTEKPVENTVEISTKDYKKGLLTEVDIAEINIGITALADAADKLLPKDLNDTLLQNKPIPASINEIHATPKQEVSDTLMDTPIKDLKKAIGVNERFLYLNELFRGDESMYERSIKTINAFEIYPEAEYWIRRELKLKLGWNDNYQTVKQFDQLVKRRFA